MERKLIWDAIVLHRYPFSVFLLPLYLLPLAVSGTEITTKSVWLFAILHFLVYPASNAYNSYYDRDEGAIGALAEPPAPNQYVMILAQASDFVAVFIAFWVISAKACVGILIYIITSRAYSHPATRLKAHPWVSLLALVLMQSGLIFLLVLVTQGLSDYGSLAADWMAVSMLGLAASFPMTQVYQHEEDLSRGDKSVSLILGVAGTFSWSIALNALNALLLGYLFLSGESLLVIHFLCGSLPSIVWQAWLHYRFMRHRQIPGYKEAMWSNVVASVGITAALLFYMAMHN